MAQDKISVMYGITVQIDTTPGEEATMAPLDAGIENLQEALNEVVNQYFFFRGEGFANNYVTGMAPAYTLTGRRIIGDAAQDFIFANAQKFGLMTARETTMEITRNVNTGTEKISCPVTFCNLTDIGGATTDGSAISVELRLNGKPTVEVTPGS